MTAFPSYPWRDAKAPAASPLFKRVPTPAQHLREEVEEQSFAAWLRRLPLLPDGAPVTLFNGAAKPNQRVHAAVIDIDTGSKDLQQCADAVLRLRAEYLFSVERYAEIAFRFTSGDLARYDLFCRGERPRVRGNKVQWQQTGPVQATHNRAAFREYLDLLFMYAGSISLQAELEPVKQPSQVRGGDVFVQAGSPGHAVIVLDVCISELTGNRAFLLAQSYMPAQSIHVLRNMNDEQLSPWFSADFDAVLQTPEWSFAPTHLRRWRTS